MDKRFLQLFSVTEDQAIAMIKKPLDELEDVSDRYVAACHLANYDSERSINALIETIQNNDSDLYHRIARRKAVESLGRLGATSALPIIHSCLADEDCYTVENAVWAIGEIGTDNESILEDITGLLNHPDQNHRIVLQTLGKFGYQPALGRIQPFTQSDDEPTKSAAIATVARLSGDYSQIGEVVELLQHESVNARRACIQDLIDAKYYDAIPQIAKSPVSLVFRLRGIRLLAAAGLPEGKITFAEIEPYLDKVIRDHPDDLEMVHEYDQKPSLEFLVSELYHTDFGRCYLATQTFLKEYPQEAPTALMQTFADKAHNDYGGHYHVVKLLGWLKYAPGYDLLAEALVNRAPQFQKSRGAAAQALGNLGDERAIPMLKEALQTNIFDLKYGALLGLQQLGDNSAGDILREDEDPLIQAKANSKVATV